MRKFGQFTWRTRKRQAATVVALMLLSASAAFAAAWFLGAFSGSAGGKVGSATTIGSITLTPNDPTAFGGTGLVPGCSSGPCSYAAFTVNNPTTYTQTITSASQAGAIIAANGCDTSSISISAGAFVGRSYPPGSSPDALDGFWHATGGLPAACQGTALSVALSGATEGATP